MLASWVRKNLEARLFFGDSKTQFPEESRKSSWVVCYSWVAPQWFPEPEPRSNEAGWAEKSTRAGTCHSSPRGGCTGPWGLSCFSHCGRKGHCTRAAFHSKGIAPSSLALPALTLAQGGPVSDEARPAPHPARLQMEKSTSLSWGKGTAGNPGGTPRVHCTSVCLLGLQQRRPS